MKVMIIVSTKKVYLYIDMTIIAFVLICMWILFQPSIKPGLWEKINFGNFKNAIATLITGICPQQLPTISS